jgi:hypothetical protein
MPMGIGNRRTQYLFPFFRWLSSSFLGLEAMAELLFQTGDELRRNRGRNLFASVLDVMATAADWGNGKRDSAWVKHDVDAKLGR